MFSHVSLRSIDLANSTVYLIIIGFDCSSDYLSHETKLFYESQELDGGSSIDLPRFYYFSTLPIV